MLCRGAPGMAGELTDVKEPQVFQRNTRILSDGTMT